jgi:hypothetical protein
VLFRSPPPKTDSTTKKAMIASFRTFTFHYSPVTLPLAIKQPELLKMSLNNTEKIRNFTEFLYVRT